MPGDSGVVAVVAGHWFWQVDPTGTQSPNLPSELLDVDVDVDADSVPLLLEHRLLGLACPQTSLDFVGIVGLDHRLQWQSEDAGDGDGFVEAYGAGALLDACDGGRVENGFMFLGHATDELRLADLLAFPLSAEPMGEDVGESGSFIRG